MNPLEIYKLLPKKNCGECVSKTCMSFALRIQSNPDALEQCRYIDQGSHALIRSMLVQGDWRDGLIKSLSEESSALDFTEIAGGLGVRMEDGKMIIRCIGVDYAVGRDGAIEPDRGNKWITILLLHYVRNRGEGQFTGRWVSFSEIKGGFVKASSFLRDCEEPLRELMDEDMNGTSMALGRLGASPVSGYRADYSATLDLLPKIRSLILYRSGDDEFPSSLKILFDGITGQFLDVESIVFLCEGLVHTVTHILRKSS